MYDKHYMNLAFKLARRGEGFVEPNPMVGCVLVKNGVVVGEGYHRKYGEPHAEVNAIQDAGVKAKGATAYVTLEPCCHTGKTPPCAKALIEAGVKKVVIGVKEPVASRSGRGIAMLKRANIETCVLDDAELSGMIKNQLAPFTRYMQTGLPWVIGKWASTLDGAIATRSGDSQWISNESSRKWVHQLRGRVDGIITGIGTVLKDNPTLTARDVKCKRIATRIVIDPSLKIPQKCKLIKTIKAAPLIIATSKQSLVKQASKVEKLKKAGVRIIAVKQKKKALDLTYLMKLLAQDYQMTNIMTEAGPGVLGHLIAQELMCEAFVFIAPKICGDQEAKSAIDLNGAGTKIKLMKHATTLQLNGAKRFGDDMRLHYCFT